MSHSSGSTGSRLVLTLLSEKNRKGSPIGKVKITGQATCAGMALSWLNSPDLHVELAGDGVPGKDGLAMRADGSPSEGCCSCCF